MMVLTVEQDIQEYCTGSVYRKPWTVKKTTIGKCTLLDEINDDLPQVAQH